MRKDTEETYIRYRDMIWRLALNYAGNPAEAEDILQEVFLSYLKTDTDFQDEEHRKAWLLRVCMNKGKSLYRSPWKKRWISLETMAELDNCQNMNPYEREDYWQLHHELSKLKADDRSLIYLYYFEELPIRKIAELMEKTEGSLRTRLYRLRSKLAESLLKGEESYEF